MSVLRCTECDRPFDKDVEVDAVYYPVPRCEDCLLEQQLQQEQWWTQMDQDEQWIEENL